MTITGFLAVAAIKDNYDNSETPKYGTNCEHSCAEISVLVEKDSTKEEQKELKGPRTPQTQEKRNMNFFRTLSGL
eukprot:642583-Rhodomonas_salina.1